MGSSTPCHVTVMSNTMCTTQALLGLSLEPLLSRYKTKTLTIKPHPVWCWMQIIEYDVWGISYIFTKIASLTSLKRMLLPTWLKVSGLKRAFVEKNALTDMIKLVDCRKTNKQKKKKKTNERIYLIIRTFLISFCLFIANLIKIIG